MICEAKVLRETREAGSTVPEWPCGNPTNAAPHWMEGKVGRWPVAWKNWDAERDHRTSIAHGTLNISEERNQNTKWHENKSATDEKHGLTRATNMNLKNANLVIGD